MLFLDLTKVFDAAIGSWGDLEIDLEDEIAEGAGGDDVAAIGRFLAIAWQYAQDAVGHFPASLGEGLGFGAAPAVGGLSVEQQYPAIADFFFGEFVIVGIGLFLGLQGDAA